MKKFTKNSGFTMVELLIVVAIIAILIAISIPLFNNALESSRHAVDKANIRDAVGLANVYYLTNRGEDYSKGVVKHYVVSGNNGTLGESGGVKPECKCNVNSDGKELTVTITEDANGVKITPSWDISKYPS